MTTFMCPVCGAPLRSYEFSAHVAACETIVALSLIDQFEDALPTTEDQ